MKWQSIEFWWTYFREIFNTDFINRSSRSDCTLIRIRFLSLPPPSLNWASSSSESYAEREREREKSKRILWRISGWNWICIIYSPTSSESPSLSFVWFRFPSFLFDLNRIDMQLLLAVVLTILSSSANVCLEQSVDAPRLLLIVVLSRPFRIPIDRLLFRSNSMHLLNAHRLTKILISIDVVFIFFYLGVIFVVHKNITSIVWQPLSMTSSANDSFYKGFIVNSHSHKHICRVCLPHGRH